MTIWILALVLLAAGAGLGFTQGAIRAAISFIGIVMAALFSGILGGVIKPLFPHLGIHNPVLIWLLAPSIAFLVVLILFKAAGFFVHRKVYLYYKYQAGDLRLALWQRLNSRLGVCVGLLNGTVYLLLISFVIYNLSYWTVQIAISSKESFVFRALNKMGRDLESTGLAAAAQPIAPFPKIYYQLADLLGLLRQNPQLKDRLENYPVFLSLAENNDFKQLGQDTSFQSAWQSRGPVTDLLKDSQVKAMLKNTELTATVIGLIRANWNDLNTYLKTGQSPDYGSEKILGRWDFNATVSVGKLLITHPKISPPEIKALRSLWGSAYAQTVFIAAADHQAFLENIPRFKVESGAVKVDEKINFQGKWSKENGNYELSLSGNGQQKSMTAEAGGLRLTLKSDTDTWVFDRE